MNDRLRSWRELVRDECEECERRDILAPLGQDRPPCVLMLPRGFRADPELLVQEILDYLDPDRLYEEPTQEEIDAYIMGEIAEWAEETGNSNRMTSANRIDKET